MNHTLLDDPLSVRIGLLVQYNVREGDWNEIGLQSVTEGSQRRHWSHSVQFRSMYTLKPRFWELLFITVSLHCALSYWHCLDHMQIVCTLLQTNASILQLSFYSPDALPATLPTASKALKAVKSKYDLQTSIMASRSTRMQKLRHRKERC